MSFLDIHTIILPPPSLFISIILINWCHYIFGHHFPHHFPDNVTCACSSPLCLTLTPLPSHIHSKKMYFLLFSLFLQLLQDVYYCLKIQSQEPIMERTWNIFLSLFGLPNSIWSFQLHSSTCKVHYFRFFVTTEQYFRIYQSIIQKHNMIPSIFQLLQIEQQ